MPASTADSHWPFHRIHVNRCYHHRIDDYRTMKIVKTRWKARWCLLMSRMLFSNLAGVWFLYKKYKLDIFSQKSSWCRIHIFYIKLQSSCFIISSENSAGRMCSLPPLSLTSTSERQSVGKDRQKQRNLSSSGIIPALWKPPQDLFWGRCR